MESKILNELFNRIPKEELREKEISMYISARIQQLLTDRGLRRKFLAKALNKYESEISKLLSGRHNFTLKTLASIEVALGENIIDTSLDETTEVFSNTHSLVVNSSDSPSYLTVVFDSKAKSSYNLENHFSFTKSEEEYV